MGGTKENLSPNNVKKPESCWKRLGLWQSFAVIQCSLLVGQYLLTPWFYEFKHWNQEYLQQTVDVDWQKGAIIDVKLQHTPCSRGYEPVNAWFQGFEWGCICGGSSKFAQVNLRKCQDKMLRRSQCYDVAEMPKQELTNLNKQFICVLREPTLTFQYLNSEDLKTQEGLDCGQLKTRCNFQGYEYCADHCIATDVHFTADNQIKVTREESGQPVYDFQISEGVPCIFQDEQNSDPRRQDYLLYKPGWLGGCTKEVNDNTLSKDYFLVENSPKLTEHTLFESNNLIEPLSKYLNFDIEELKKYDMNLYKQQQPPIKGMDVVHEFIESGEHIDTWVWWIDCACSGALIAGIVRVLVTFMHEQNALKKHGKKIIWIVSAVFWAFLVLLFVALVMVQVVNIRPEDLETHNHLLVYTLQKMQKFCDSKLRFVLAQMLLWALIVCEGIFQFYQLRKSGKLRRDDHYGKANNDKITMKGNKPVENSGEKPLVPPIDLSKLPKPDV